MNDHSTTLSAVSLSEHFKCLSAAALPADKAAGILEEDLRRYGPVLRFQLDSFADATSFLVPLKSFTTRFIIFPYKGWSLLISDMRHETCLVDALRLSRVAHCSSITVCFQPTRREFTIFRAGKKVRQVQSLLDSDRWYFRQEGQEQPFEDTSECSTAQKSERLSVNAVRGYFSEFTGLKLPIFFEEAFTNMIGLQRSLRGLLVPVVEFETTDDLPSAKGVNPQPRRYQ